MSLMTLFPAALLALACLAYIFWSNPSLDSAPGVKTRLDHLRDRLEVVYSNLRDLNFEFRAGKYAPADYNSQRETLELEAEGLLQQIDRLEAPKTKLPARSR